MNTPDKKNPKNSGNSPNPFLNEMFGTPPPLTPIQQAAANDRRLEDLAIYVISEGQTKLPNVNANDPATSKTEYMMSIGRIFTQLKVLVKRGSFTIEELEGMICRRYGIVDTKVKSVFDDIVFMEEEPEKLWLEVNEQK